MISSVPPLYVFPPALSADWVLPGWLAWYPPAVLLADPTPVPEEPHDGREVVLPALESIRGVELEVQEVIADGGEIFHVANHDVRARPLSDLEPLSSDSAWFVSSSLATATLRRIRR